MMVFVASQYTPDQELMHGSPCSQRRERAQFAPLVATYSAFSALSCESDTLSVRSARVDRDPDDAILMYSLETSKVPSRSESLT